MWSMIDTPANRYVPAHGSETSALESTAASSALADVDAVFDANLAALESWSGPYRIRERLIIELRKRHQRQRQTLIRKLADLHQRAVRLKMFGSLGRLN